MKAIIRFLNEARTELAKVSWPTRRTVVNMTIIVVVMSVVSGLVIAGFDLGFTEGIKGLTVLSEQIRSNSSSNNINSQQIDVSGSGLDGANVEVAQ